MFLLMLAVVLVVAVAVALAMAENYRDLLSKYIQCGNYEYVTTRRRERIFEHIFVIASKHASQGRSAMATHADGESGKVAVRFRGAGQSCYGHHDSPLVVIFGCCHAYTYLCSIT